MIMENKNYYEVLDISTTATVQEVHDAYTRAKNTYSTDSAAMYSLLTTEECEQILNQIEEAYSVLGSPDKKVQYDQARGFSPNQQSSPVTTDIREAKEVNQAPQEESEQFELQADNFKSQNSHATKTYAKSRFSLDFQMDNAFEEKIKDSELFTGELLKEIREYKNVSIERMSDMTKFSKTHVRNIEEENLEKLPAEVYTRGFVYQYAKCLKLDPDKVASSYMKRIKELKLQPND